MFRIGVHTGLFVVSKTIIKDANNKQTIKLKTELNYIIMTAYRLSSKYSDKKGRSLPTSKVKK